MNMAQLIEFFHGYNSVDESTTFSQADVASGTHTYTLALENALKLLMEIKQAELELATK